MAKSYFSKEAKAMLASVSDQPWALTADGAIRILNPDGFQVCPVSMAGNKVVGSWKYTCEVSGPCGVHGVQICEGWDIARAADFPRLKRLRAELIRLIGGLTRRDEKTGKLIRYIPR